MKKFFLSVVSLAAVVVFVQISCSKGVSDRTANLAPATMDNTDADAGEWKMILLKRPDTFAVAAPAATNSPGYIAELNEIKGAQKSLTAEQQAIIRYWSAGASLRWNEILRGLVAKHNLPPYQKEDGTYPGA